MKHQMLSPFLALMLIAASPPPGGEIRVVGYLPHPFDAVRLPDKVLAEMRGGVQLPNGLIATIGIDIQTRVDDVLVLHTVYASDGPTAGIHVFTDGTGAPSTAPGTIVVSMLGAPGEPEVIVDRSPTGTTIVPVPDGSNGPVNIVTGDPSTWLTASGQTPVPVSENGPPVTQGPGTFSLATDTRGAVVTLDTSALEVQQLVGQATGVVVANTGNNRMIDTVSSVNVDLQGISPTLLAGLFTADRLAFESATGR